MLGAHSLYLIKKSFMSVTCVTEVFFTRNTSQNANRECVFLSIRRSRRVPAAKDQWHANDTQVVTALRDLGGPEKRA